MSDIAREGASTSPPPSFTLDYNDGSTRQNDEASVEKEKKDTEMVKEAAHVAALVLFPHQFCFLFKENRRGCPLLNFIKA